MYLKYKNAMFLCLSLILLISVLAFCSPAKAGTSSRKALIAICNDSYSDNAFTECSKNYIGKDNGCTAIKVNSPKFSESQVNYRVSGGIPNQFYVITTWIKTSDFRLQYNSKNGIAIMCADPNDYNRDWVYSDMIKQNTIEVQGNDNGWIQLNRVVKLDGNGCLSFAVQTGWSKNKSKGKVIIDQVKVTPLEMDNNYIVRLSNDGTIRMVFKASDLNESRLGNINLQEWLNTYAELRKSMKWLIGDLEPYEGTTDFILTENLSHYGLAGNPIYINRNDVVNELKSIELNPRSSDNNLLWGYIHEMGHTFDGVGSESMDMRWVFDAEFFATLKCVCVLSANGYGMGGDSYIGDDIFYHFENAISPSSGIYNSDGLLYRLMHILSPLDDGGWEALHKTFISFNALSTESIPPTKLEKYRLFIHLLSVNSGIDIEKKFTEQEWEMLIKHFQIS